MGEWQQVLKWMRDLAYVRIGDLPFVQGELAKANIDPDQVVSQGWDQKLQLELYSKMVDSKIIVPRGSVQSVNDMLANVRNHFNLLQKLGFGYRNRQDKLFISDMGRVFISTPSDQLDQVLERQLVKLQFSNPSLDSDDYQAFRLFPYVFVLRLLHELPDHALSTDEFHLFVAHACSQDEIDYILSRILTFRALDDDEQHAIVNYAAPGRPEIDNARVHLGMFGQTPALKYETNILSVKDMPRLEYLLAKFEPALQYVEYEEFEDWYSYIGAEEDRVSIREVLAYYTEVGKTDKAKKLVAELDLEGTDSDEKKSFEELLEELFSERLLEDALERKPSLIEPNLKLVKNGRQYRTDVGPIDLLCVSPNGQYVVVELKKAQAEDKVIGQTLRYMGWVRLYLSQATTVRGIIVARDFSDKLRIAVSGMQQTPALVTLRQFTLNTNAGISEVAVSYDSGALSC